MNDDTTNLDQTDEEILTYTASDEALEASAGTERGFGPFGLSFSTVKGPGCFGCV
jgi:hypothetical protein